MPGQEVHLVQEPRHAVHLDHMLDVVLGFQALLRDLELLVAVKVAPTLASRTQAPRQTTAARFEARDEVEHAEARVELEAPLELPPEVLLRLSLNKLLILLCPVCV